MRFSVSLALVATALPAQELAWLSERQGEDGRWHAADPPASSAADFRVTVWMCLAILGDGSTLDTGPFANALSRGIDWLLKQQDPKGRLGLRTEPDWLLDHVMACYALAEAVRLSQSAAALRLEAPLCNAIEALIDGVSRTNPPVGIEHRLRCEILADVLHELELETLALKIPVPRDLGAAELESALHALPPVEPRSRKERAAQLLRQVVSGQPTVPADFRELWPEDPRTDPWTTFYVIAAAYRLGGKFWKYVSAVHGVTIGRSQEPDAGCTWPPVGDFGTEHGRIGTSAACMLSSEIYYRYSWLHVVDPY